MIKMFDCLLKDKEAERYEVDTTDTSSKDFLWSYEANGEVYQYERIHGVSMSTFYDVCLVAKNACGKCVVFCRMF